MTGKDTPASPNLKAQFTDKSHYCWYGRKTCPYSKPNNGCILPDDNRRCEPGKRQKNDPCDKGPVQEDLFTS